MERELTDVGGETIAGALAGLGAVGVVVTDGQRVCPSETLRRLDALGLIAV